MDVTKECTSCGTAFCVTQKDLAFYDKVSPIIDGAKYSIPSPTLCFDCRQQRKLSYRNERNFYSRKCDLSGEQILSVYSPDSNLTVYGHKQWYSDKWDAIIKTGATGEINGFYTNVLAKIVVLKFLLLLRLSNLSEFIVRHVILPKYTSVNVPPILAKCYSGFLTRRKCSNHCFRMRLFDVSGKLG